MGSSPISGSHFLSYLDGKLFHPMASCLDFSLARKCSNVSRALDAFCSTFFSSSTDHVVPG